MFTFFKLLSALLMPPALILLGMAASVALAWKRRMRAMFVLLTVTMSVFYLLTIEPVAAVLAWTLERGYRQPVLAAEHPDAAVIVVLGSGAGKAVGYRPLSELSGASWRRLWRAVTLSRELHGAVPVLYAGGTGDPFDTESFEGTLAQSYGVAMGIPQEKFWVEPASRTTYENAIAVQRMLAARNIHAPVFLVTSAWHLPRAVAVFRHAGVSVIPVAADFHGGEVRVDPLRLLPSAEAFASSMVSVHEWAGMAAYWISRRM
ncbi:YdcF family protein [Candidatus Uhrbacteria bacterium]|nr:YdcF family protein [Candidatus Uhrbacteria bacterium]